MMNMSSSSRLVRPNGGSSTSRTLALAHRLLTTSACRSSAEASTKAPPKTLAFQKSLPRLPVPPLEPTFQRYIKSLRPLLLDDALKAGKGEDAVAEEIKQREEWAKDFTKPGGLGRILQERLRDIDRTTPNNWLDDKFWLKTAYHSWRVPLPVNSNWWILLQDDVGIPESVRSSVPPTNEYTEWQVKRAAKLTQRLVDYKLKLDRVFGVTRIPSMPVDELVHATHPHPSTSIVVIVNDHYYKLPVVTPELQPVDIQTLEAGIWAIAVDAASRPKGDGVGVGSGDARDDWSRNREYLLALDPQNRKTMTEIEDSMFILSLDDYTLKSETYQSSSPTSRTPDLDAHLVNAATGGGNGRNRWWDKGISIHVETNGRAGMLGEHSPCDALIPSFVADDMLAEGVGKEGESMKGKSKEVERLDWVLDETAKKNIESAQKVVEAIAEDSDAKCLWYEAHGVEWIKKVAKQSPDAYLQMALQLAYHKTHDVPVATYETASTRLFLHGRTDVIRTLSEDSWRWVLAMREGSRDPKELYGLLSKATAAHTAYTKDSSVGKGCDRHLMGLRLLLQEGENHPVFEDPIFSRSQAWILSTSGLSAGERFFGTGFGTVWSEGYGVNYLSGKEIIKFGVESKKSSPETSSEKFRQNLFDAMNEMKEISPAPPSLAPTLVDSDNEPHFLPSLSELEEGKVGSRGGKGQDVDKEGSTFPSSSPTQGGVIETGAVEKEKPWPEVPLGLVLDAVPDSRYLMLSFAKESAHPADPLTWSYAKRYWLTFLAAVLVMNTALASSAPSGAAPFLQERFGQNVDALMLTMFLLGYVCATFIAAPLSEAYGRRATFLWSTILYTAFSGACIGAPNWGALLVLRFFAGLFGAVPPTGSGAVCGDVWTAEERGTAMSYYSVATFAGPAVGPVLGSFAAARIGWEYVFVILTAISGVILLAVVFACPETYPLVILNKVARELRESTGDDRIVSRLELGSILTRDLAKLPRMKSDAKRILATPFVMLVQEPTVIAITLYMLLAYGMIYLLFVAYPLIFDGVHNLGAGYSSLPFLATIVGAVVSVPFTLWYQKKFLRDIEENGGKPEPEMRLPMCEVGGVLMVISFLWLGWTGYKTSTPWILPALAGVPQGVASIFIFRSLQTYLIDTYERNAASATAAAVVCRSAAGAGFPLFADGMFHKLGIQWGCTLLALIMLVFVPVPFIFRRYGARIRKGSKWASGR
ncbi:carnitine O-acetyltransferase [Pseudohyphozyma bogoriensis]|nr:carnitine O-acetyltransferase [Pseudohyphozyma bogoriensis]